MVSQVGLNTSVGAVMPQTSSTAASTTNTQGSLFTNYTSTPINDYSNDIMMSGINFGQIATTLNQAQQAQVSAQTQQLPQQQTQQIQQSQQANPAFSGNGARQTQQVKESQVSQTVEEQEPKSSNIAKILGAATGLLAPIVPKTINLIKGGKFKELFKLKELAVACPIFGVVGLGMGMLLDSCIDAKKAKSQSAKQTHAGQQNQTEIIQNFLNGQQTVQA